MVRRVSRMRACQGYNPTLNSIRGRYGALLHLTPSPGLSTFLILSKRFLSRVIANIPPEVVVAPPALYLLHVQSTLNPPVQVSAQNCFTEASGAFTGEISPNQLKDANIHWVILGHSERRSMFGDTDKLVADKVKAAVAAGLGVIACVGESLEEREANKTKEVVERQLDAIAKEVPESVWS